MKKRVNVHTGEIMVGKEETVLHSQTNRACLVICAYDANHKIGGLAHALFSNHNGKKKNGYSSSKDAANAIDAMVKDMTLLGSEKDDIEICLVTGENVPHEKNDPTYGQVLNEAKEIIELKHIKCRDNIVTDIGQAHITMDVETGEISYL